MKDHPSADHPSAFAPSGMTASNASDDLPESWFAARSSIPPRRSSLPPPVQTIGGFLGDALADAWLR